MKSGIKLIKYWLEIDQETQLKRLGERIDDPRKHWKLSPMDMESRRRWYQYSIARDEMFAHTDTEFAPWFIVPSNDQRIARLNCIKHLLSQFPYQKVPIEFPQLPEVDKQSSYDDVESLKNRNFCTGGVLTKSPLGILGAPLRRKHHLPKPGGQFINAAAFSI